MCLNTIKPSKLLNMYTLVTPANIPVQVPKTPYEMDANDYESFDHYSLLQEEPNERPHSVGLVKEEGPQGSCDHQYSSTVVQSKYRTSIYPNTSYEFILICVLCTP